MSEAVDSIEKRDEKVSVGEFIKQTREEIDKTTFPGRDEVTSTTIIVIINVIFFAVFLYLVDQFWVYILQAIEWLVNQLAGI